MSHFDGLFGQGAIPVLEKALAFREARHALLVRNIANASTPGYRPVDLDEKGFQRLLGAAVQEREARHPREFRLGRSESFGTDAEGRLLTRPAPVRYGQVRHDGNPFNAEREMSRLADNALAHSMTAQLLAGSYQMMDLAIRGRA